MTKSHARGRRRADVPRTNSLQAISQAVASNAGSVGRQAAVVAAASGLIVTLGVPGQATAPRDVSAAPVDTINPERVAVKAVKVAADKKADVEIERASFTAEEKPEPVVIAVSNDITPTTRNSNSGSSDSMAPMTRQSRSGGQESAPQQQAQPKAETKVQTSNLSGIAATAAKYVGVPYVWGGNGPSGWDCSGFVKYVYAQHGINIARGTSAILGSGQFVRTSNPKPGDLVFQNGGGHVGIYLGGGQMIGAQNPTVDTMIHSVSRNPLYGYYTLAG
ncbi:MULTISPECIES: C40 family peptidase [Glutamicibacter]|uniref:Cell wall-associated NlpC family hydrolase n=1 Tax=Glutamicibacter mysorens TaxID=257984 RepID=A0ABX4MU18_9MICC|nr:MULTISPECIES: C40 family peptidase [Glutamicibacter]KWR74089.1 cell wall lytic activity [Arthrobacter sp. W1]PJJ42869.1 cell wall-associated NlpC family hydrolase [Glutamicibacter mysorens]RWZ82118.1 peptidoglycan endopeptidase [Glutamicibacter sp. HZAU]